jgi:hypothetical protein
MATGLAEGHFSNQHANAPTVKQYLKEPTLIRDSISALAADQFITESLFTQGYNAQGGAIKYMQEAVKKYVEEGYDPGEDFSIAEGTEFHQVYQTEPAEVVERVKKYAIEGWITYEDEDRNQLGSLARLTQRMMNTMVQYFDSTALNMLATNSNVQLQAAGAGWYNKTNATVIDDIMQAADKLGDRTLTGGETYNANTLVMSRKTYSWLRRNVNIQAMFDSEEGPTNQDLRFGGQIASLAGIPLLVSPFMRDDMAFVLERGTIGGIADEVPLTLLPIERVARFERIYVRAKRLTVAFLTDPKALCRITGINVA